MKIIQSFAQFDEGSPYLQHVNKPDYVYLSFYCFLLSKLTITEHCGGITMYCNQKAYDSFFKYITYDNIVIKENENKFLMWSKYKIDVMKTINDDFIHVDSDVFVRNNVFRPFINNECDVLIQDIVPHKINMLKRFAFENKEFLAETRILTKPYDGRSFSCGTIGINKAMQEYYFTGIDVLYEAMLKFGLENILAPTLLLEEQLLYYITIENDFKYKPIVPNELLLKYEFLMCNEMVGYLHFWTALKYKKDAIDYIRKRIFFEYPEHYETILRYERDVLSQFKFFHYFKFPLVYSS